MFNMQSTITKDAQKKENKSHNKGKNQSRNTADGIISSKGVQAVAITNFYRFKNVKESINLLKGDMEVIKISQIELLKMKNTLSEMENKLDGIMR